MRVGLVGCVKSKLMHAAPARDLYTSALFRGRRAYVERTCDQWFVLSAKHGLVDPSTVLEPYDESLSQASVRRRQAWSRDVLDSLEHALGDLRGIEIDAHAGAAYLAHGLVADLRERGATVEIPTQGKPFGKQLAFYRSRAHQ